MSSASASGRTETDRLVDGFAGYLRRERGVSTFTVDLYVADVRRFLAGRGIRELSELTPADVSHAVLDQVGDVVAGVGAALRVRAALVPPLLLRHRAGRARPVGGGVAGVGPAAVVVAPRHHTRAGEGVAARV